MTMIERVAFRLAVKFGHLYAHGTHEEAWAQMKANNAPSYRHCMEAARDVLAAIREPTEAMKVAGAFCEPFLMPDGEKYTPGQIIAHSCYTAMIDAALQETR